MLLELKEDVEKVKKTMYKQNGNINETQTNKTKRNSRAGKYND